MYSNHTCPRCASPISLERMLGSVVVCSCGWSANKSFFDQKGSKLPIKKLLLTLSVAAVAYMAYDGKSWGKHYPERLYYKALTALKQTTAKDEARMATVCKELKNHRCAAESYTKALSKSPKTYELAGALGIELAKIGEADRAILTFQNFFSHADGNDQHMRYFAQALSKADYIEDATEWYYKSLQANSKNFGAAKDLIKHLVKNELHTEALSVIGHYNTIYPKTQKTWAKLTAQVKSEFEAYTSKYDIQEMKIAGINKYLHAPVRFGGGGETLLFLVDPDSDFLSVDMQKLKSHGISYKEVGTKELNATNGRAVEGVEVILAELNVGPFSLKDVKAVACDGCAFLLGKDVMKRLNYQSQDSKGIRYITLKQ
jgi:Tfp pilus assembly protein PilF